jgi:hypothetical protein
MFVLCAQCHLSSLAVKVVMTVMCLPDRLCHRDITTQTGAFSVHGTSCVGMFAS